MQDWFFAQINTLFEKKILDSLQVSIANDIE